MRKISDNSCGRNPRFRVSLTGASQAFTWASSLEMCTCAGSSCSATKSRVSLLAQNRRHDVFWHTQDFSARKANAPARSQSMAWASCPCVDRFHHKGTKARRDPKAVLENVILRGRDAAFAFLGALCVLVVCFRVKTSAFRFLIISPRICVNFVNLRL